jgi:ribokinase
MSGPGLVVVGSYNRDTSLFVAQFPKPGETVQATGSRSSHGGKGSNQAVQAARLGGRVSILACVGADRHGHSAVSLWETEGIAVDAVARHGAAATGSATILVDEQGENLIIIESGANAKLSTAHVDASAPLIGAACVVVSQLELPVATVMAAFSVARREGVVTVLNAAPAPKEVDRRLLALTDYLVVNEGEACTLAGGQSSSVMSARRLATQVRKGVILTLGSKGAVLLEHELEEAPVKAPSIVPIDTTGAGDAVVGAFAAMLATGSTAREALAFAVKAGSFACTARGAVDSFGRYAEISALS